MESFCTTTGKRFMTLVSALTLNENFTACLWCRCQAYPSSNKAIWRRQPLLMLQAASAAQIRDEIEAETHRFLAGKGRPVAPDPIQLTIYSPSVPNLTLVDMPGRSTLLWNANTLCLRAAEHAANVTCVAKAQPACMLCAGLTKVPIDGQPKSIVKDLDDMARTYIKVCSTNKHCMHASASRTCHSCCMMRRLTCMLQICGRQSPQQACRRLAG